MVLSYSRGFKFFSIYIVLVPKLSATILFNSRGLKGKVEAVILALSWKPLKIKTIIMLTY